MHFLLDSYSLCGEYKDLGVIIGENLEIRPRLFDVYFDGTIRTWKEGLNGKQAQEA